MNVEKAWNAIPVQAEQIKAECETFLSLCRSAEENGFMASIAMAMTQSMDRLHEVTKEGGAS